MSAFNEKAQVPTDEEREALPVASRDVWGWDTCVVCGSKEVSDRGMIIMGASNGAPYVARIAWCDQSQECREDLRQTSFLLTESDAKVIDGFRRTAQTEPTPLNGKWVCGKCAREVAQGVDDGQIPEHHRTCPKRAQTEPTETKEDKP